jgi:DNA-binding IclR family transcriptional regulator
MALCSGIKVDGGGCKAQAMRGSEWCIGHDPDKAEARRRRASKGGRRGGRGRPVVELAALRTESAEIRRRLLEGGEEGLAPNVVAVAVQSLNTDARLVVAAPKAREQEELEQRLEELEELVQSQKEQEGGRWGA